MAVDKKEDTICYFNTEILNIVEECLKRKNPVKNKSIKIQYDFLIKKLEHIQILANNSLDSGQKMEDRLYEYRNAIEELGFIRKEKDEE